MSNPTSENPNLADSLLFEQFATLATAPDGIGRLRALILQLAVQGRLGTQDAGDEPASVLFEVIRREKDRLVKDGKLQKEKPLKFVNGDDVPFKIPKEWIWTSFGQITFNRDGARIPIEKAERATRHGAYNYYGASGVIDTIDDYLFDKPLLLIGEDGANLVNRSTPIAFIAHGKYWVNNHAHVLDGISFEFLRYLEIYINSIDLRPYLTGMAQPKMNQAKMNSIPVPLPPLAEQHRIVAKVDRLMALCDELEARQQQERAGCLTLGTASFAGLQNAESPEEFGRQWAQVCDAFDQILDCPENVAVLRQTILQLAVQGRLVRQDPGDEPAGKLVERIRKEKEQLVKERKGKKEKSIDPVVDDETPFVLPNNWMWCRFGEVATIESNIVAPDNFQNLPHIAPDNIEKFTGKLFHYQTVSEDDVQSPNHHFYPNQIVYSKIRPNLSKLVIVEFEGLCSADMYPIYSHIFNQYLKIFMLSLPFYHQAVSDENRLAMPKINQTQLNLIYVAIPPLAEQHRIVAKVDALMALCDQLEAQLKERAGMQGKFADAVVKSIGTG